MIGVTCTKHKHEGGLISEFDEFFKGKSCPSICFIALNLVNLFPYC